MFANIRALFRRVAFMFKVNFYRAALADNRCYSGTFTLNFKDSQHIFPIYLAENFVNLLHTSHTVPGLVFCRKPKNDTIGTMEVAFFCNRAFCLLSDKEKLGAYFHEIGHLHFQHLLNKANLTDNIIDSQQCELEADTFALMNNHGDGLISFLVKLRNEFSCLHYRKEDEPTIRKIINNLNERIAAAENYCSLHAVKEMDVPAE